MENSSIDFKKDYQRIKYVALFSFFAVFIGGEDVFYIALLSTLAFFSVRPSAYLALLFFSGLLKTSPVIKGLPVDLTLVTFCFFSLYFLMTRLSNRSFNGNALIVTGVILCFAFVVLISLWNTPAPDSYLRKSGYFVLIMYVPLVVMILNLPLSVKPKLLSSFLFVTLLIAYPWVALGLHNQFIGHYPPQLADPRYQVTHLSAFGEDYMAFSSFVILLFLEAFICFFFSNKKYTNGVILIILTYALLNSPARGLTVGLIFSLLILFSSWFRKLTIKRITMVILFVASISVFLTFYLTRNIDKNSKQAISRLLNFDLDGSSIGQRISTVKIAFAEWIESPFFGTGIDSIAFYNGDSGLYAHNVLLEVLFEYGLIGGIPMFLFLFIAIYFYYMLYFRYAIVKNDIYMLWFCSSFIAFFCFGMFSGSLGDMRNLWIMLGLIIFFGSELKKKVLRQSTDGIKTSTNNL